MSESPTTSDSEAEEQLPSIHALEVKGTHCPSCGHPTLMLLNGYITCTLAGCPNPDYAEANEARIAQAEIKGRIDEIDMALTIVGVTLAGGVPIPNLEGAEGKIDPEMLKGRRGALQARLKAAEGGQ